ncbi:hemolymph lipopolysaccharide-binding protein [Anabrus simplex]|uniref:hemolymph lipopolysaccharide-binding protein n=1 Tax=Anabrus simplex TaxID=316456 RepID=UPI0035A2E947
MMPGGKLLLIFLVMHFASHIKGNGNCDSKKQEPVKIVLRSLRSRNGRWEGRVNVKHSYNTEMEASPIHVDLHRNGTDCNFDKTINLVADIVVSPSAKPTNDYDVPDIYKLENVGSYTFHTHAADWQMAKQTCEIEGSRLAIINSETEAKELANILSKYSTAEDDYQAYLGASDIATEGFFINVEGLPLNETGFFVWRQGAPSARTLEGDCVTIGRDGKLNAVGCKAELPFFCEIESESHHSDPVLDDHH